MFVAVNEQDDVTGELEALGVLAGIRWAYNSATWRTLEIFSEADGHDEALLGNLRHTLFRDRLDRVFTCDRYDLQPGSAATAHLDLLYAELAQQDINTMPRIVPTLVRRADVTGSPGWAVGDRRFLLASCSFHGINGLPWSRRSSTKQRVAMQPDPNPAQASLFDDLMDEMPGLEELLATTHQLDMETFVVAHTLDHLSQEKELVLGRPRLNRGGGPAWYWYRDLLITSPTDGGREFEFRPLPSSPNSVADAPVRLRGKKDQQRRRAANG